MQQFAPLPERKAMQQQFRCRLFLALLACAFAVAAMQRSGEAQLASGALLLIAPTAAAGTCVGATASPTTPAALYQITNAGNQATAGTITFYDESPTPSCNSADIIWRPLQLGPAQTISFGTIGIRLKTNGLAYMLSTPPATTIVVTW
jgi:hypothetical protein